MFCNLSIDMYLIQVLLNVFICSPTEDMERMLHVFGMVIMMVISLVARNKNKAKGLTLKRVRFAFYTG